MLPALNQLAPFGGEMKSVQSVLTVLLLAAGIMLPAHAGIINHYPSESSYPDWPNFTAAVPGLDSPIIPGTSYPHLDFVGDSAEPVLYHASDSQYVYFRVRVHFSGTVQTGTGGTFHDTIWLYFDISGWGNEDGSPDYAVAWDSKGNVNSHGLELLLPGGPLPSTWAEMATTDIDEQSGQKLSPPDFNTSGDGYLRTVDGVATANFGTTTFVDFAIRWSYLSQSYNGGPLTNLAQGQTWRVALASVHDQTDHALPNVDVAGASLSDSPALRGWSREFVAGDSGLEVPETPVGISVLFGLLMMLAVGARARPKQRTQIRLNLNSDFPRPLPG